MKRVVVTGIGVVSCLGNNQDEVYQSLLSSKSGISFSEEYKEYNLKRVLLKLSLILRKIYGFLIVTSKVTPLCLVV